MGFLNEAFGTLSGQQSSDDSSYFNNLDRTNQRLNRIFQGGTLSSSSSSSFIDPNQAAQLNNLYNYAGNTFNQYSQNPSQLIAQFNPTQLAGQQYATQAANGVLQNLSNQGNAGFAQSLNYDPTQSPYYASALQATFNPFVRNFTQNILPGIRSQAVGVGRAGSGREGIAQGLATQGLLQQLGDISANMGNNAYNTGAQTRLGALGYLPSLQQSALMPSNVLQDVGAQQQAQQQRNLYAPFTLAQMYQGLLGNPTVLNQQRSDLDQASGGAMDTASDFGKMFSGGFGG